MNYLKADVIVQYKDASHCEIIEAAERLVEIGKLGTLSRMEEMIEFAKSMNYLKLEIAYCYGMENQAKAIETFLFNEWFDMATVSCSVGGLTQSDLDIVVQNKRVLCNPLGQAEQLIAEKVDFPIIIGLCLGHDILIHKNLNMDFTTLVVNNRKNSNAL